MQNLGRQERLLKKENPNECPLQTRSSCPKLPKRALRAHFEGAFVKTGLRNLKKDETAVRGFVWSKTKVHSGLFVTRPTPIPHKTNPAAKPPPPKTLNLTPLVVIVLWGVLSRTMFGHRSTFNVDRPKRVFATPFLAASTSSQWHGIGNIL